MRNYIILNNKNSNTISGLIIQELAPISKPQQRTQVETIDGRDGDIVTPLGYAAYNKKIKIGLYGDFDINEVIAYFATKGTAIFSNEPDKYYYYQIVDQIDYERLVRYRVATVTMHVQPFKYSATEGTITVDSSDTVSDEGSDIALDNTAEAPFNVLRHKGNATQKTLSGKNLINFKTATYYTVWKASYTKNDDSLTVQVTEGNFYASVAYTTCNCVQGTTYTFSMKATKPTTAGAIPNARLGKNTNASADIISLCTSTLQPDGYYLIKHTFTANSNFTLNISFYPNYGSTDIASSTFYDVQLELGAQASDYEEFCGGIPSPSPDYPQDIQVVTGDSTVKIEGKNRLNLTTTTKTDGGVDYTRGDGTTTAKGTTTRGSWAQAMPLIGEMISAGNYPNYGTLTASNTIKLAAGTYTLSANIVNKGNTSGGLSIAADKLGNMPIATTKRLTKNAGQSGELSETITVGADDYVYLTVWYEGNASNKDADLTITNIQLEAGSQASQFEPHKEQSYVLPFGDTYLAKIGDYADEPVKVDGTWYIRRAIGKVVLDGTEATWAYTSGQHARFQYSNSTIALEPSPSAIGAVVSDHFTASSTNDIYNGIDGKIGVHATVHQFWFSYLAITDLNDFKTWLGTHPTTVYYALATPTDEAITDQDLIDALDELYDQAHSYKGHTHITATAADGNAPAVLSVEVGEDNESTVTNAGNTTSRPILTIYGQGDIGVYINDVEVLDVALGDEEYITLDSVEMEAYKDTTANLKNRLVTGDYSKLALNAGDNKIRFTGTVTKYEISKYSRWL